MSFDLRPIVRPNIAVGKGSQGFIRWTLLGHIFHLHLIDIDSLETNNCADPPAVACAAYFLLASQGRL
jgi:hypothetical protein